MPAGLPAVRLAHLAIPGEDLDMTTAAQPMALDTILSQFRDDAAAGEASARNNRDLGDRFERLMQPFFRVDPLYAGLFSEVWMGNEWPGSANMPQAIVHDSHSATR